MRILVLGGDGFCGWPAALQLSSDGHQVWIADNLARRQHDQELGTESLTPIATPQARLRAWHGVQAGNLEFCLCDAGEYEALRELLEQVQPQGVVHYAEQRAAPYSMKSPRHRCYTLENNLRVTHNLLCALAELKLDAHLVHLGTMGVYGYGIAGITLPEGYLKVQMAGDEGPLEKEIRFPDDPGSLYHMTKCLDQQLFAFYNKNDGLRITDLHQGIVWGTQTSHTLLHPDLINRFDYDGDFGTVLNRFAVQATVGHPLTVHGRGLQMRAFIHLEDSVRCIQLALATPPVRGQRVRILNQMTEVHRVLDLARKICELTGATWQHLPNPRKELEENHLRVEANSLLRLGLSPRKLDNPGLEDILELAARYAHRCDPDKIPCRSYW